MYNMFFWKKVVTKPSLIKQGVGILVKGIGFIKNHYRFVLEAVGFVAVANTAYDVSKKMVTEQQETEQTELEQLSDLLNAHTDAVLTRTEKLVSEARTSISNDMQTLGSQLKELDSKVVKSKPAGKKPAAKPTSSKKAAAK